MAFFKTLWKNGSKHKKLNDEWDFASKKDTDMGMEQPGSTLEGITFNVKYLGTTGISHPSSSKATADAVKTIVNQVKNSNKKQHPVQLAVNLRGITVIDGETKEKLHCVSLYKISYCSADATHSHVFAYIAADDDETLECYAFMCPKRKTAQLISITVAQTFNTAFHLWQMTKGGGPIQSIPNDDEMVKGCIPGLLNNHSERRSSSALQQLLVPTVPMLIDLTTPIEKTTKHAHWTSFDD